MMTNKVLKPDYPKEIAAVLAVIREGRSSAPSLLPKSSVSIASALSTISPHAALHTATLGAAALQGKPEKKTVFVTGQCPSRSERNPDLTGPRWGDARNRRLQHRLLLLTPSVGLPTRKAHGTQRAFQAAMKSTVTPDRYDYRYDAK
jgi:hypothetical protein